MWNADCAVCYTESMAATVSNALSSNRSTNASRAAELLAPAGDFDCVRAAVENGADAVYFGLDIGFNARARAANIEPDELPASDDVAASPRRARAMSRSTRSFFRDELAELERTVRLVAAAGVDAVLVQDLGAVRLIQGGMPDIADPRLDPDDARQRRIDPRRRIAWASSGWCWPANCRSTRSPRSAAPPRCRWRCSSTGPCAWPTRASA